MIQQTWITLDINFDVLVKISKGNVVETKGNVFRSISKYYNEKGRKDLFDYRCNMI